MNEQEFIRTLLFNLARVDILEINIAELSKKLYPYYINPKYGECFKDILLNAADNVDLTSGICEEFKEGNITFKDNDTIKTHYNKNSLESMNIKARDYDLIMQIVTELNIRHHLENENLNIYGIDPNKAYMVGSIRGCTNTLITDGRIKILSEEVIFRHPLSKISTLKVSSASYVSLAGKSSLLEYYHIYTKILDYEKLKRIKELTLTEVKKTGQKEKLVRVRKL